MTQTIKDLTVKYLDSLGIYLSRNGREFLGIVKLNSQSGWIIFNAKSLKRKRGGEVYDIESQPLIDLLKEQIKTYHRRDWKETFLAEDDNPDDISINDVKTKFFYWVRGEEFNPYNREWIAVDKRALGDKFGSTMMDINNVDLTLGKIQTKRKERLVGGLLDDPEIKNSTPPQIEEEDESGSGSNPSKTPSTKSIQFTIQRVISKQQNLFIKIEIDSPLNVDGKKISKIVLNGFRVRPHFLNGDFAVGNTVFIGYNGFTMGEEGLVIGNDFAEIKVVSSEGGSKDGDSLDGTEPPPLPTDFTADSVSFILGRVEKLGSSSYIFRLTPQSPFTFQGKQINTVVSRCQEIVTLYQNGDLEAGKLITIAKIQLNTEEGWWEHDKEHIEGNKLSIPKLSKAEISVVYGAVRQKNIELAQEENSWLNLVTELTSIIKKNNTEVCSEAAKLGLKLPAVPLDTLKFFQEDFFVELEEKIPLTNPTNQQIIAANESIRKKKENIKTNIYQIYNRNLKRLADYKDQDPNSTSELDQLKNQVIEAINKVLTDKDNLRNIDLTTLEDGKYLNWEEDLDQLLEKEEVTAYQQNFLAVLKKLIAQERTKDDPSKSLPQNNEQIDISKISKASSLTEARNIAKKLIRELFVKYRVKLEDVETIWLGKGEKSWMEYLNKLNDYEQVKHFVQEFEEQAKQKAGLLNPTNSASLAPLFTWLIIGSIIIVGLTLIIGLIYQKYHSKEK